MKALVFLLLCMIALVSCKKDKVEIEEIVIDNGGLMPSPNLPDSLYTYDGFNPPPHLTGQVYDFFNSTPGNNPVTNEGATLGRVLFYDKQLSANNTISCASCHQQEHGFSDPNQFSEGLYGEFTSRNSMSIVNSFMGFRFFWDHRAFGLEQQSLMPIENPVEMDMILTDLEIKLSEIEYYPQLFEDAFGTPDITSDRISKALSQFMRSIYSYNSKFDQGVATNFANFTPEELQGKDLFFIDQRTNCNNCHQTYYFFDTQPHNNGLESVYSDLGVAEITGNNQDVGLFKTPTLRNIEYTAPYFHDGRFATLKAVVQFYNTGIQPNPNLDERLTTNNTTGGPPRMMNLTNAEMDALVAFLKTLSEPSIKTEVRWSDPF